MRPLAVVAAIAWTAGASHVAESARPAYQVNDAHFHLTNYVQEGTDIRDLLRIMGDRVGRVALFGIPLQQTWSYRNTGNFAPTYYLQTDSPLYYYSFTVAHIAMAYLSLPERDRARFDPMITGFNPADMYGVDHIKRVLRTFPGVFTGTGEFTIHKEFVRPIENQLELLERALSDPASAHVSIDISWMETAKYIVATPETTRRVAQTINRFPDRFLLGTDEVASTDQASYLQIYDVYQPLFAQLTPEASEKLRKGNYERLFDEARRRVRAWEKANVK
jgi:hypothetical protein